MDRRRFLLGAGAAGVLAAATVVGVETLHSNDNQPLALVYRESGPASCPGCSEAVATLLQNSPSHFRTEYVGPDEATQLTADALRGATLYAQPGGGDLAPAWRRMRKHAGDIRDWVHSGGRYLGFCLGGYLAGATPGFDLLPGDTDEFSTTRGASVDTQDDTLISVLWRGKPTTMYFQDGPVFRLRPGAQATVLATYNTGAPAAVVAPYGRGRVGVVGPHPEADQSWYTEAHLSNPQGIHTDMGFDLIQTTMAI